MQNLLANAIKFRGENTPRIVVSAEEDGADWEFHVADNGIGIEAHHAERIFRMFQRLHTREEFDGSGIGLALCQRVLARHGGRIWVEPSTGPGSVFSFTLPRNQG
jgi:light-regulated signal transduction histidine kinase (bacteriophytochrome)